MTPPQDFIIEIRPSLLIKPSEPLPDNAPEVFKCPDGKAENSVQPRRAKPTSNRSREYGVSWRTW